MFNLCKFHDAEKEEVFVYSEKDGKVREWLQEFGYDVFLGTKFKLEDVVELVKPDIVVCHVPGDTPVRFRELKEKTGVKIISVVHTRQHAPDWVDKIICVSNYVYDHQLYKDKSVRIYPGVEKFPIRIGNITRIAPYKLITDMFMVADILKANEIPYQMMIIGEDAADAQGYIEQLKKDAETNGLDIFFTGYKEVIPWNTFDYFFHPIGDEAYPNVLQEAQVKGKIVITYSRGGAKEINGLYLADTLLSVAEFFISRYKDSVDIRDTVKQFNEVYEEVLK